MSESRRDFVKRVMGAAAGAALARTAFPADQGVRVGVIVGPGAPEVEHFAAAELCRYLNELFHLAAAPATTVDASSHALFLIGSPQTNPAVAQSLGGREFPKVSAQGFVLRQAGHGNTLALIVGGGSPAATLWAVYELIDRWGVRYFTDRDVLPAAGEFHLPKLDVVMEPAFAVRAHPTIQDFADSGEAWGFADFRPLIDQLAKLKFNRLNVMPFGWQPYLDWECKGIHRRSAWLWYNFHYPITSDMVGRKLFEDRPEFWNPDLPYNASYSEMVKAGERLMHRLMAHGHARGMKCCVYADLTQFPPEFAPLLKDAQVVHQTGRLVVVPGPATALDDPQYIELCTAVLRATINTYPETDFVSIGMPEWRQWTGAYKEAWQTLDSKYGIGKVRTLDQVLTAAANRNWGPIRSGGEKPLDWSKKAVEQVKGDLASLVFYDRLLDSGMLKTTRRPDMKFSYDNIAEELWPLLGKVLPAGSEASVMPDNFQTELLRRREIFETFPAREVPGLLDLTLDDDNIGIVPQLTGKSVHELVGVLQRDRWAGFIARERFPSDHDCLLAYVAKSAWHADATPDSVAREQIGSVCGQAAVAPLLEALSQVEAVTTIFEHNDFSFSFPVPGTFMKYWKNGPELPYLTDVRKGYALALEAARQALAHSKPDGQWFAKFWVGRITFAGQYVLAVQEAREAAKAEAAQDRAACLQHAQAALAAMREALEAYAGVARNRTDLGAIAVANEYAIRPLRAKVAALKA